MHLYIIDAIKFEYSAYLKIVKLTKIILVLTFNFFMYTYIIKSEITENIIMYKVVLYISISVVNKGNNIIIIIDTISLYVIFIDLK